MESSLKLVGAVPSLPNTQSYSGFEQQTSGSWCNFYDISLCQERE